MSNNDLTFSKAYEELQQLTREFESGNLDLEVAIPKFKRAAELGKFLKKRLSELENQIEEIHLDLDKDPAPNETSSPATETEQEILF